MNDLRVGVYVSPMLDRYLASLVEKEGFGFTQEEVILHFVWAGVNRLIENGRLTQLTPIEPELEEHEEVPW